ncbi:ABC transporter substrate-binding protein [Streptomyces sp. NPDC060030]|uniref:ABC transporter substrate-binding protein n=1 Tax=Streptomyces sp. NPDC060030 TaxID=3347042 RepID=UPI0036C03667
MNYFALPLAVGLMLPFTSACAIDEEPGDSAIVVGTTDTFTTSADAPYPFDPAAAYDVGSWNVLRNTFHTLLRTARGGSGTPIPDAASWCGYTDRQAQRYRCKLRDGLTFSDGTPLNSGDVKYSIERVLAIRYKAGPYGLLANIDKVDALGDKEIIFHLAKPDATFPLKLSTPAASIVNRKFYPEKKLRKGFRIDGSGPYTVDVTAEGDTVDHLLFKRNDRYRGGISVDNDLVELRTFKDSKEMSKALKGAQIDVMSRTISPDQLAVLRADGAEDMKLVELAGLEIRYLGFNTLSSNVAAKEVRQAIACIIDRGALVKSVYPDAELLYSIIPQGVAGHVNSFFNRYGDPDIAKAAELLASKKVKTPVPITLHYTTDHYGSATEKEFEVIAGQLNSTGLFQAKTEGSPWGEFRPAVSDRKYEVYGMGWFPDFPDPDGFVAPLLDEGNFLNTPYVNRRIREHLIPRTRMSADRLDAFEDFEKIQDIVAEDVPFVPLWAAKQYVAVRDGIRGAEWAVNPSAELQLWEFRRDS